MSTTPTAQALGDRVQQKLKAKGISQVSIGNTLGLPQSAVSNRLLGRIDFTIRELEQIADILDIPLAELIGP